MIDFNYNTRVRRVQLFEGDEGATDFAQARKRGEKYALTLSPVEAWLVVHGLRDCVNKDAWTHFTGELFIHAARYQSPTIFQAVYRFAASVDAKLAEKIPYVSELNRAWSGGIVGRVELDGQYEPDSKKFTSYWHERGMVGWRFANAQAFDARVPCRGNVGFWRLDGDLCARVDALLKELPASGKSVVRKNRTTQKAAPAKSTIKQSLTVANPLKSKRVGKTAMRAEYAKLAKKLKGPRGVKKEAI